MDWRAKIETEIAVLSARLRSGEEASGSPATTSIRPLIKQTSPLSVGRIARHNLAAKAGLWHPCPPMAKPPRSEEVGCRVGRAGDQYGLAGHRRRDTHREPLGVVHRLTGPGWSAA